MPYDEPPATPGQQGCRRRRVAHVALVAVSALAAALAIVPRAAAGPVRRSRSASIVRFRTADRVVALTFDDGPDPRWTPTVLRILRRDRARATFFLVGRNALAHRDLVQAELAQGDEVGNHTLDHADLENLDPAAVKAEIERGAAALRAAGASRPTLFRPPKGHTDVVVGAVADADQYRTVLWDVCVEHFVDGRNIQPAVNKLVARVRPGSIILAHDGGIPNRSQTLQALPLILRGLQRRHYRIVTVGALLAGKGVPETRRPGRPPLLVAVAGSHRQRHG